jgi:hypothetical protein
MSGSPIVNELPYGSFQDFTTQSAASTTANYPITLDTLDYSFGVNIVDGSKITFNHYGTYNLLWSGQFANAASQAKNAKVWIKLNGTDVLGSGGFISVPAKDGAIPGYTLAAWNYLLNIEPGDYIQFYWHVDSTLITLATFPATTSPAAPGVASMIVTTHLVGNYRPNVGAKVGVMYLGGDPNFPIWTGEIS